MEQRANIVNFSLPIGPSF